jgi:hypothetical protein
MWLNWIPKMQTFEPRHEPLKPHMTDQESR